MIITIDGGAGTGKSYVAEKIAVVLNLQCVHTGTLYRLLAFHFLKTAIGIQQSEQIRVELEQLKPRIAVSDGKFCFFDQSISQEYLNSDELSIASAQYSQLPFVRQFVNDTIRSLILQKNIIAEGRDCGTVIFPNADYKFFFYSDREKQLASLKYSNDPEKIRKISLIRQRNHMDSHRKYGALRPADNAVIFMIQDIHSLEKVYEKILAIVTSKKASDR